MIIVSCLKISRGLKDHSEDTNFQIYSVWFFDPSEKNSKAKKCEKYSTVFQIILR